MTSASSEGRAGAAARSLLFVPGDRPERFPKAAASGAHEVILDLEDAVAPSAKAAARAAVAAWLARGRRALVRINAADTAWHGDDLSMVRASPGAGIMLPKADPDALAATIRSVPGRRVVALLETVDAYMELERLAATPGLARIAFGSIDFAVDSGISDEDGAMAPVRTRIVLASRHAGLEAPVDGVSPDFSDEGRMRDDALLSKKLGFGGKLCIHPRQVAAVNAVFLPSLAEVERAGRILAAFEASGGAATAVDGRMIDKPVVDWARRVLAGS